MKTGTVIVSTISTNEVTLRLPGATERADGSIWATKNQNPLVMISHLSNVAELKKKYAAAMKARKPEQIANEHIARIGEFGDKRVEWCDDYKLRTDRAEAEKIFPPRFGVAKNGKPYIAIDTRESVGETISLDGVVFRVDGEGKAHSRHLWTVRNVYVVAAEAEWEITPTANFAAWRSRANLESERHHEAFNAMMEDEFNDGACPPAPGCKMLWKIVEAIKPIEQERAREITVNLSSRGWGDYSPVTWIGSSKTDSADYLSQARERLANAYDVDQPNQTDDELMDKFDRAVKSV